ncbi:MAG: hypothetical protein ACI9CO_002176 [Candidatus Azotimanducaceae bacterium]
MHEKVDSRAAVKRSLILNHDHIVGVNNMIEIGKNV